jgi:CubicO group peptidase (beta-lactamase class C family)
MMKQTVKILFVVGLVIAGSGALTASSDARAPSAPFGLWVWEAEEPPRTIALTLSLADEVWAAQVNGATAPVFFREGQLSVALPDGQRFSGVLDAENNMISGHWLQPASDLDYMRVATPVAIATEGGQRWHAEIDIQPRPFHVFLDVFNSDEGDLLAVVRNPEGNNTLGATRHRLVDVGPGEWNLVSGSGERQRRRALAWDETNTLLLDYGRFNDPIALRPALDNDKALYYSRYDLSPMPSNRAPDLANDGWRVASPEAAGFDPAVLENLTHIIGNQDPRRAAPQLIHSILVSRSGELVYEEYFYGHDREQRHDVRSVGKVFGSVMVGALQQEGHAITTDHRPIARVLETAGLPADDPRKAEITLAHLMTFTSGLDCDVNSDSAGSEMRMWEQSQEPNYWLYTSQLDMLHDPGARYAYCSGSANLVGASLREFGAAHVHELFDRLIAEPLQFGPYHWALAPNGEGYLGGGMYMRPRDLLKIGAMYVAGGVWNGTQIVEVNWVEESTSPKIEITPETTGMSSEVFGNNYFGGSQGYIWTVNPINVGENSYASYQASGNGGQLLIIVPEFEIAVVMTGGNYRMGGIWGRWRDQIVGGYIIPSLLSARD